MAQNLKGLSFTLDLTAINFVVGSNFAGKTARADAIRLLLLGHLPELGKLPRSTFRLCSASEMVVSGDFDDGSTLSRRWWLKGDAVKTEVTARGKIADVIEAEDHEARVGVMLDASRYFALSDRERVAYVFANVPIHDKEFGPAEIIGRLKACLDAVPDASETNAADPRERFLHGIEGSKIEAEDENQGWTAQSFLEWAVEYASEQSKGSRAAAVTFEKTAQGLAHIRAAEALPEDGPKLDAERNRLTLALRDAQAAKANITAAYDLARSRRERRRTLESEVSARGAFARQLENLARDKGSIAERLASHANPSDDEIEALRSEERDAAAALAEIAASRRQLGEAIVRNEAELAGIEEKTACPYCGASGEGWKALKRAEIESALSGLRTKKAQVDEHYAKVSEHDNRLLASYNAKRAAKLERRAIENALGIASGDVNRIEKQLAVIDGKAEELKNTPAEDPKIVEEMEKAQGVINAINEDLRRVEDARRTHDRRQHDLRRLAEAEKARDDARADEAIAKLAADFLREEKAKMVAAAFGPLLTVANELASPMLKTPLSYNEGEIGTWRSGTWVPHDAFSGTERAIAYASIQAALTSRSPVRIAIVDELGRLDDANAAMFAATVKSFVDSGRVDQFVGIDAGRLSMYRRFAELETELTLEVVS